MLERLILIEILYPRVQSKIPLNDRHRFGAMPKHERGQLQMLQVLLGKTLAQLLPEERKGIVIFGSSALVLQGVNLGRDINDLDLFVSEATFEGMTKRFEKRFKAGKDGEQIPYLAPVEGIEILHSFPGIQFHDALSHACKIEAAEGLLVGSVYDIRKWKIAQGREKDLKDIEAIDNHLKSTMSSR